MIIIINGLPRKVLYFLSGIGQWLLDSHDFMLGVLPPRQWSSHKDTWCCHHFDWSRESDCKDVCSPNPLGTVDFFSSKDTVLSHGWSAYDRTALGDMFRGGSSYSFQMHMYFSSRYLVSDFPCLWPVMVSPNVTRISHGRRKRWPQSFGSGRCGCFLHSSAACLWASRSSNPAFTPSRKDGIKVCWVFLWTFLLLIALITNLWCFYPKGPWLASLSILFAQPPLHHHYC